MANRINRREFLGKSVAASAAAAGLARSAEERILTAAVAEGTADAKPGDEPSVVVPKGKLGNLEVSRLILGGNLIGGWAHSRDLIYVSDLLKAYNNEAKIFETMALAERHGVNTVLLNPAYLAVAKKYNETQGGRLQVISEIHVPVEGISDAALKDEVRRLMDLGASTIYIQGMVGDRLVQAGRVDLITRTMEAVKAEGLSAGVGSHTLEVTKACEEAKVPADYYVKTFHAANYPSADSPEERKEWFEPGYYDNIWCTDAAKVKDYMAGVRKPWLAFKVLAAGAIHPSHGFLYAFENGADFVVVGMFDFQIRADADIASRVLARKSVRERARPWFA